MEGAFSEHLRKNTECRIVHDLTSPENACKRKYTEGRIVHDLTSPEGACKRPRICDNSFDAECYYNTEIQALEVAMYGLLSVATANLNYAARRHNTRNISVETTLEPLIVIPVIPPVGLVIKGYPACAPKSVRQLQDICVEDLAIMEEYYGLDSGPTLLDRKIALARKYGCVDRQIESWFPGTVAVCCLE